MVRIKNIEFRNFRNFKDYRIKFDNKVNILFGENGCGKTNILEGISLNAKGRGLRNPKIYNLIKNNEDNFLIKNNIEIQNNLFDVEIFTENNNNKLKKNIKINGDSSKESLDFLYQSISYLIFLPEMERLFQASPSYRRNFLDRLVFSGRNNYNTLINKYKKFLLERVHILQSNSVDEDWLNQTEREISLLGLEIYKLRKDQLNFINSNMDILRKEHNFQFNVNLKIKDDFFNNKIILEKYVSYLQDLRLNDKKYGGTKIGPHKSDVIAIIDNELDASLLSTGQQKTVVLMILLAQCNYLVKNKNINPILLFDEIGSHLDSQNRKILLDMINRFDLQFFLTGTHKNLFSFVSTNARFYNITNL